MSSFVEFVLREFVSEREGVRVDDVRFVAEDDAAAYGYMAQVLFGRATYRVAGERGETESLAIKKTFDGRTHFDDDYSAMQLDNEMHFYSRIVPFLERVVGGDGDDDGGDGDGGRVTALFPKFLYGCARSTPHCYQALTIYENLHRRGYRQYATRPVFLDYAHLSLMMRKVGQLHAFSRKAVRVDGKQFQFLTDYLPQMHERFLARMENFHRPVLRRYLRLLRTRHDQYATKVAAIERTVDDFSESVLRFNAAAFPSAVVCHGDYTGANVVFRYENGRPVDMKMLDLGIWRVASPVLDIGHVLYVEADQRTRNRRWDDLLECYRAGLGDILPGHEVPSKERIESLFRHDCLHAAIIASSFIPTKIAMAEESTTMYDLVTEFCSNIESLNQDGIKEAIEKAIDSADDVGGAKATEAVLNVLRDMIDRQFI